MAPKPAGVTLRVPLPLRRLRTGDAPVPPPRAAPLAGPCVAAVPGGGTPELVRASEGDGVDGADSSWLVVHPEGRLLFDTGIHRDATVDPARRFGVRSRPGEEVGHAPGHQSLWARSAHGPLVMTADACYTEAHLAEDRLSGVVWDPAEMSGALATLRRLRDRDGARILYGHDPAQWQALPRPPTSLDGGS